MSTDLEWPKRDRHNGPASRNSLPFGGVPFVSSKTALLLQEQSRFDLSLFSNVVFGSRCRIQNWNLSVLSDGRKRRKKARSHEGKEQTKMIRRFHIFFFSKHIY